MRSAVWLTALQPVLYRHNRKPALRLDSKGRVSASLRFSPAARCSCHTLPPYQSGGGPVMVMGLTRKVMLTAIVFLVLLAIVATSMLFAINAMRQASALLSDEVVPQLDAKGDFNTSMTHALDELEVFIFSQDATHLDIAQQAAEKAQEALARMGS